MCTGAALDVFTTEPLPRDSPLWDNDRILISPHNADLTDDILERTIDAFIHKLHQYSSTGVIADTVNKDLGY